MSSPIEKTDPTTTATAPATATVPTAAPVPTTTTAGDAYGNNVVIWDVRNRAVLEAMERQQLALTIILFQGQVLHLNQQVKILSKEVKRYQKEKLNGDIILGVITLALVVAVFYAYPN